MKRSLFRETIARAFKDSGLSQAALSERSGVMPAKISRYLSGAAGLSGTNLERIATALGLELREVKSGR